MVALGASVVMRRRRPDAPTQGGFHLPTQIDRADFDSPDVPWIVVLFTSSTCDACREMVNKAVVLRSREVAVVEVEYGARRDLHERYAVDAVPAVVIAGPDGTVRAGFLGPTKAQDVWAAVAECREPGSTPEHGLGTLPND
jgi:thioredoxin-like negative regulator of GroEL